MSRETLIATGLVAKITEGNEIAYTPSVDTAAGSVVVINGQAYVARGDLAVGLPCSLAKLRERPHWIGPKATGTTFVDRAAVYWDASAKKLTSTSGGNTFVGYAVANADYGTGASGAYASGDTYMEIESEYASTVTVNVVDELTTAITDPGNAGAIPVTIGGHVDIVTAGAETRTLAAPTFKGQSLLINMKTDGGDCVITCATTVNQTGNNTITLNDAGDAVLLVAKTNGANIRWSVVSNDGASLSTV